MTFGRHGERNPAAKLTTKQVIAIREADEKRRELEKLSRAHRKLAKDTLREARRLSQHRLAADYGVRPATISAIVLGTAWKRVI